MSLTVCFGCLFSVSSEVNFINQILYLCKAEIVDIIILKFFF
jgi:hypothetical protein